jgi:hypothetical protein
LANHNEFVTSIRRAAPVSTRQTLLPAVLERHRNQGPGLIALGLLALLAAEYWSWIPIITGVALIALGATLAVHSRFRSSPALPTLVAAHLLVYLSLYFLFLGAVFHAAFAKPTVSMPPLQCVDLGLSIVPMVAAIRIALSAFAGHQDVATR